MSFSKDYFDSDTHTAFGEQRTVEKTRLIELKSIYGISNLRDVTTTSNSGAVTNDNVEYKIATTANGSDSAILDSGERGRYIPGSMAEAGLGVRLGADGVTGDHFVRWGYFDDDDGMYFGLDSDGIFVAVKKNGTETKKVYQNSWNGDRLDGSDESGDDLDVTDGRIYQIRFSWYGYGVIEFIVSSFDSVHSDIQEDTVVHRFTTIGDKDVSVDNPNLPIRIENNNNGTAEAFDAFVAGRQFSILGRYEPNTRISGNRVLGKSGISTAFLPVMTFRRKSGFSNVASVKIEGLDLKTDKDLLFQFRSGTNLSTASQSFGSLTGVSTGETSLEVDTGSTNSSGGEYLYEGLVGASGSGNNAAGLVNIQSLGFDFIESKNVTLLARLASTSTSTGDEATIDAIMRLKEEF